MRKFFKLFFTIIAGCLFLWGVWFCYDLCQYAKAVTEETKIRTEKCKIFFLQLAFAGEVIEKIYCEECEYNKFTLAIKLIETNTVPPFFNTFPPYFSCTRDSLLTFEVSKELFKQVKEKDSVYKNENSFNLIINKHEYLLDNYLLE